MAYRRNIKDYILKFKPWELVVLVLGSILGVDFLLSEVITLFGLVLRVR